MSTDWVLSRFKITSYQYNPGVSYEQTGPAEVVEAASLRAAVDHVARERQAQGYHVRIGSMGSVVQSGGGLSWVVAPVEATS